MLKKITKIESFGFVGSSIANGKTYFAMVVAIAFGCVL